MHCRWSSCGAAVGGARGGCKSISLHACLCLPWCHVCEWMCLCVFDGPSSAPVLCWAEVVWFVASAALWACFGREVCCAAVQQQHPSWMQ